MSDSTDHTLRYARIRDILFERGQMRVPDLAQLLGVSAPTVRRDLAALEARGMISRQHGSARIADAAHGEAVFGQREGENLTAKRAIAARALDEIAGGETVFLDAGTTVLQLARYLRLQPRPLVVITNGLAVAGELAGVPGVSVNLLGGRLRAENLSLVGPQAIEALERIWIDRLFLGVSSVSEHGRIASYDADEAFLNAQMVRRASAVHVLADQSKFCRRATFTVTDLAAPMSLITDRAPVGELAAELAEAGVRIVVAEGDRG